MGDAMVGLQARLMSQALRKLTAVVSKSGTCLIFINQIREKIGVMFGNPETTTGGRALKFYSSVRLDIRRINSIKDGDAVVGSRTKVKVVKNKVAPPFKVAEFDIGYGEGISKTGELIDLGVEHKIVEKSGAWFSYGDLRIGQGRENTKALLRDNPDVALEIENKIREKLGIAPGGAASSRRRGAGGEEEVSPRKQQRCDAGRAFGPPRFVWHATHERRPGDRVRGPPGHPSLPLRSPQCQRRKYRVMTPCSAAAGGGPLPKRRDVEAGPLPSLPSLPSLPIRDAGSQPATSCPRITAGDAFSSVSGTRFGARPTRRRPAGKASPGPVGRRPAGGTAPAAAGPAPSTLSANAPGLLVEVRAAEIGEAGDCGPGSPPLRGDPRRGPEDRPPRGAAGRERPRERPRGRGRHGRLARPGPRRPPRGGAGGRPLRPLASRPLRRHPLAPLPPDEGRRDREVPEPFGAHRGPLPPAGGRRALPARCEGAPLRGSRRVRRPPRPRPRRRGDDARRRSRGRRRPLVRAPSPRHRAAGPGRRRAPRPRRALLRGRRPGRRRPARRSGRRSPPRPPRGAPRRRREPRRPERERPDTRREGALRLPVREGDRPRRRRPRDRARTRPGPGAGDPSFSSSTPLPTRRRRSSSSRPAARGASTSRSPERPASRSRPRTGRSPSS